MSGGHYALATGVQQQVEPKPYKQSKSQGKITELARTDGVVVVRGLRPDLVDVDLAEVLLDVVEENHLWASGDVWGMWV